VTQESARLLIPFQSLGNSVRELSLNHKVLLWELLDDQIAQPEKEVWDEDPAVKAEI
jgi:hypothetical protein